MKNIKKLLGVLAIALFVLVGCGNASKLSKDKIDKYEQVILEIEENIDRYESIVPDEGVEHVSDDDLGFLVEEHNKAAQAMEEMILDILEVAPGDYNGGMIRAYKDASEIASKKEYRILSKLSVYKLSLSETISYIMGK
jgi:lipoprotein